MIINTIHLKMLRNGEFIQFATDVLDIVSENNPVSLGVEAQHNDLKQLVDYIEILFRIPNASRMTGELVALNDRRNEAFIGISALISGYGHSADKTIRSHAVLLADHLEMFGNDVTRDTYSSETTVLRKIVEDWTNKPELKAALTALNLDSWIAELAAANTAFETKYVARVEEKGSLPQDTIKAKRAEAVAAYNKLRDRLDSYYTVNEGAEPYASVANTFNALVDRYNILLTTRNGRNGE